MYGWASDGQLHLGIVARVRVVVRIRVRVTDHSWSVPVEELSQMDSYSFVHSDVAETRDKRVACQERQDPG